MAAQLELFSQRTNIPPSLAPLIMGDDLLALEKPIWVDYPVGSMILRKLAHMLCAPASHRPPGLLIYGDSHVGKTSIAKRFRKLAVSLPDPKAEVSHMPVMLVEGPYADVGYLLGLILERLGAPEPKGGTMSRRLEQVRHLARTTGLRLLIIDEIHTVLASPVDKRSIFLNTLKHLSNELELPIALIGTIEAVRAVQTDQQLGNRFEPVLVPRWKLDTEYATFLSDLAGALGVGGNFGSRELVKKFHSFSEGLTGETWKLLVWAAQKLKPMGADVDLSLLDALPWRRPSERRRLV
jgi:hypothetical protein